MKKAEKLDYLQRNHMVEWISAYVDEENKLSSQQQMFCLCGQMVTGLHEGACARFRNKVLSQTLHRLKHLLPKAAKAA